MSARSNAMRSQTACSNGEASPGGQRFQRGDASSRPAPSQSWIAARAVASAPRRRSPGVVRQGGNGEISTSHQV